MSLAGLPSALRLPVGSNILAAGRQRSLHTSPQSRASILFALGALSNSRETQHFNKLTRLSRVEHSPPLKLIKSSEVDPFPLPTPSKPAPKSNAWQTGSPRTALRVWDEKALQIGRVFLTEQARRTHRLQRALDRAKRREIQQNALMRRNALAWHQERRKLQKDMRAAGAWILLSIGTATVLATWRFWPDTEARTDNGELGRKIAAKAAAAMPLPAAVSASSEPFVAPPVSAPPFVPLLKEAPGAAQPAPALPADSNRSWWRSLFWKQQ